MTELRKTFDPAAIEAKWYAHWETSGAFRPARPDAEPFTIVMPPPNVTGSLHIGHALDNTLQDILIRHARLQGKDALWVVGTDHAGIATQMVVERQMALHQQKRTDLSRDDFVARVWEWKAESGGTITQQLRRLGASCDWANERFTMDEGFSKAVTKVFVDFYDEGLIYRDKRLVNWDPGLRTAISDLEVEQREVNGHFWHFRYPLEDGSGYIAIATTRPETILGDGAVAVNPADERYVHLVGKRCRLPIVDRLIPIIADDHVKIDFGSGAVKITAAHDWNDYDVARRHPEVDIPLINLMNADATMSDNCPPAYRGLDRYVAREKVVAEFAALGLLDKVEDHVHMVPYGDRSGVVIEPWLTDQWYVDAAKLARPAIDAVTSGAIRIVPATWEKTWFQWLENIQPWCVSRQLWWGHRIPAWYGDKLQSDREDEWDTSKRIFVAMDEFDLGMQLEEYYGTEPYTLYKDETDRWAAPPSLQNFTQMAFYGVHQDNDVLDTWFSSALWPFATLGWPNSPPGLPEEVGGGASEASTSSWPTRTTPNPSTKSWRRALQPSLLPKHYPSDVLVSGFDILFFWDARMAMQSLHVMGEVPWKTLYLHGLVRAADGSKMSKSKGNTVDPLGLIDRYGADALRFTLAAMESQGRDIKLDEKRVEGYRNFATKLWNAARFLQGNGVTASSALQAPAAELAVNRWIIGEVVETLATLDRAIADLRYDAMADAIYQFAWGIFCDWYIELVKGEMGGGRRHDDSLEGRHPGLDPGSTSQPAPTANAAPWTPDHVRGDASRDSDSAAETRAVAGWAFDQILVMLHPFMPFITEELWHAMGERPYDLIHARWPEPCATCDIEAKEEVDWLISLVTVIRSSRAELNIPPGARTNLIVHNDNKLEGFKVSQTARLDLLPRFRRLAPMLNRLARVDVVEFALSGEALELRSGLKVERTSYDPTKHAAFQLVVSDTTYSVPVEGIIDLAAERARLTKSTEAAEKDAAALASRLANPSFVERAKPEAVDKARADHAERVAEAERLRAALARLG